jgi:ketosteroid isomerase-like protein
MSQANVEIVRRCFDQFRRGDTEALLAHIDPAIETIEPPETPGGDTYLGYEGLAKAFEHWAGQWDDFHVELEELVDAGSDVIAVSHHRGTGRTSGVPVEGLVAYVFTVHEGRLVRMRIFNTRSEALEAVGLLSE